MQQQTGYILGKMTDGHFKLHWKWQLVSTLVLGVFTLVLLNLIFGLVYRNYTIIDNAGETTTFFMPFLLFMGILIAIRAWNNRLEKGLQWNSSLNSRILAHLVLPLLTGVAAIAVIQWVVNAYIQEVQFIRLLDQVIIVTTVSFGIALVLLCDFGIFLLNKWKQSATEVEKFKKESMEYRFDMLRNQVNPHFLFNSLNTLASLIYENQDQAADFVRQMAKVYRYVLENKDKELISLGVEHEFLKSYLYLIQIRFASGLHVDLNLDQNCKGLLIPMTVQLLIENAIKHNIVSAAKPLHVSISNDNEYLTVSNNLQKKTMPEPSTNTGLSNIKSRYNYLSEKEVRVEETNDTFLVKVPLIYE